MKIMANVFMFLIASGLGCLFVASIFYSLWLFVNREKFEGFIMFACIITLAGVLGLAAMRYV